VSALLVAAALVVATGSVAALATADARLGLLGLAAALVGAGLVADPLPGPAIVGEHLTAALLAVALLRAADPPVEHRQGTVERDVDSLGHLGWPVEALLVLAGAAAGLAISSGLASFGPITGSAGTATPLVAGSPLTVAGWSLALAGGLIAISLPALLNGAGLRRASAAVIAVQGVLLARSGLAGPPDPLADVVLALLLVTVAAAAGLLAAAGRAAPVGSPRQA
jgi:hypothetical protein